MPEYSAVMEWAPTERLLVVHVAIPPEVATRLQPEITAPLSLKLTTPAGVPAMPVIVAVKVTD